MASGRLLTAGEVDAMPRDDGLGDFRELLLLQHSRLLLLLTAGVLGLLPLALTGAIAANLLVAGLLPGPVVGLLGYCVVIGALAALAYRRGQIPYRRGDLAALIIFTLGSAPVLEYITRAVGQEFAFGVLLVLSLLPALILDLCWRPLFLLALRRLTSLHLDTLVHESLREHYGDDWQAYRQKISADLREARRLRDQAESDAKMGDEAKQ